MMEPNSPQLPPRDPRTVLSQPYVIPTPIRRISSDKQLPAGDSDERKTPDPAAGTGLDQPAPASPKKAVRTTPSPTAINGGGSGQNSSAYVRI